MQFRMAGSPRLLQAFYRVYFRFWIPVLAWASTWWPLGLMYWMARRLVITPFAWVRPKYMRVVRENTGRILSLPAAHRDVRKVSWQMMFEHAYHWIDFFRYSQLPIERLVANIAAIEGEERFLEARRSGRGTLLLTAHMGNPEVAAVGLGRHLEPVHVLYWRDRFATAEEFRTRMRLRGNVRGIPVDASPLSVVPALRVLREGGILAAHGDRDVRGNGLPATFFGAPAVFPRGPFLLAARSEALIVPCFFLVGRDRRFHLIYEAPLEMSGSDPEDAVRRAMDRWVSILERRIRSHPEQWYCFYPFWESSPAATSPTQ